MLMDELNTELSISVIHRDTFIICSPFKNHLMSSIYWPAKDDFYLILDLSHSVRIHFSLFVLQKSPRVAYIAMMQTIPSVIVVRTRSIMLPTFFCHFPCFLKLMLTFAANFYYCR